MMQTTIDFIDALKASKGGISDYALANILGVTQQTISKYRVGKDYLGDKTAIKVADFLKLDRAYVMACAHAERAKDEVQKQVWQDLVKRLGGVAAALLLGILALPYSDVYADGVNNDREYVYYVKSLPSHAARLKHFFISLFSGFPRFPAVSLSCSLYARPPHP